MVYPKFQGESLQGGPDGTVEQVYIINDAADRIQATAQLLAYVEDELNEEVIGRLKLEKVPTIEPIDENQGWWVATARYTRPDLSGDEPDEPSRSFNTSGGSQHITNSLVTVKYNPDGGTAADHKGAIGVSADGDNIEGTDIVVPVYEQEETHHFAPDQVTADFRRNLRRLTGTVNASAHGDFARGEGLFLGASGQQRGRVSTAKWEIQYRWAGSPNAIVEGTGDAATGGIQIRGIQGRITKLGWEYLWIQFSKVADDAAKRHAASPVGAYVETVYGEADWADLGIPPDTSGINDNLSNSTEPGH